VSQRSGGPLLPPILFNWTAPLLASSLALLGLLEGALGFTDELRHYKVLGSSSTSRKKDSKKGQKRTYGHSIFIADSSLPYSVCAVYKRRRHRSERSMRRGGPQAPDSAGGILTWRPINEIGYLVRL
jgi:hypothetical protein